MTRAEPQQIAVALVLDGDWALVGVRPEGKPLAGYYEFPGGKIETGETPDAAAVRETREETGLDVEPVRELLTTQHVYPHGHVELHFILARVRGDMRPPRFPFAWLRAARLERLCFPPANAPLLDELRRAGLISR
ncbi:MAG: (deoxy)nucleoside triphosphate pyrophosphohydrolase [Pirellulales bacterium]|nr:(deoxy)nucleoside triphosphate pyrophosphohydrolase [Pirellulales bacterium]